MTHGVTFPLIVMKSIAHESLLSSSKILEGVGTSTSERGELAGNTVQSTAQVL
jgi:hypothetical protein